MGGRSEGLIPIYLEVGAKRTFASAVDWPGWSRGGRYESQAIAALLTYADRYKSVVENIVPKFRVPADEAGFTVVKRLKGNATTDFGVPGQGIPTDSAPVTPRELQTLTGVLEACWSALDAAVKAARGVELRKGPRGGGRDLHKIAEHVLGAEQGYIVQLGARPPKDAAGKPASAGDLHAAIIAALQARARGLPVAEPSRATKPWTPRYFARRAAWHVLDHVWEIEDRAIRRA